MKLAAIDVLSGLVDLRSPVGGFVGFIERITGFFLVALLGITLRRNFRR